MVILCDTKDKQNKHILDEFDKQKIEYKTRALKTGDYSFMIKACPELGFQYDTYFVDELCIERKNSLSELAGNLAQKTDDNRIFKELNRMINIERAYLVIENDCLDDIYTHNYKSEYNPDSYIRTLLTWQSRNNMHIYFVKKENDYSEQIKKLGGRIYELPRLTKDPIGSLKGLYKIVKENQYKIVIRHTANALVAPQLLVAKMAGAETWCHSHNETDPQVTLHKIGKILMHVAADKRFACSEKAGKWMYGKRQFCIIENAINVDKFIYKAEKAEKIRQEFGLDGKHVYGHIANFIQSKNHMFLLEVYREIADRDENAVFFCLGEGDLRPQIEEKIRQLKLQDKVILTGIRHDAQDFMSALDVLIFPSFFEGLPLTLIEAQIAALPALISDTITKDVVITEGLVTMESIQKKPEEWAKTAMEIRESQKTKERTCQREPIRKAGYDMDTLVEWYEEFFSMHTWIKK